MNPAQKRAIIVMIESIEHQMTAVKAMLTENWDSASGQPGHRVVKQAQDGGQSSYLSDQEEDEIDDLLMMKPPERAEKEKLLHDLLDRRRPPNDEEPPA